MSKENVSKITEEVVDVVEKTADQVEETVTETVETAEELTHTVEVEQTEGKVKRWITKNRPWIKKTAIATLVVAGLGLVAKSLVDAAHKDDGDATDEYDFDLGSDDSDNTEE